MTEGAPLPQGGPESPVIPFDILAAVTRLLYAPFLMARERENENRALHDMLATTRVVQT